MYMSKWIEAKKISDGFNYMREQLTGIALIKLYNNHVIIIKKYFKNDKNVWSYIIVMKDNKAQYIFEIQYIHLFILKDQNLFKANPYDQICFLNLSLPSIYCQCKPKRVGERCKNLYTVTL